LKIVVTGGGTGGHVFPALEVALGAKARGWQVEYFGSERGQERSACGKAMMPFTAFPAEPVVKPLSPRGIRSISNLLKATKLAIQAFESRRIEAVFATGGYSAAPILNAAKKLGIPIVIHEQNSVPGRTNRLMSRHAKAVCTVFHAAAKHFPGGLVHRTGMPIRSQLRDSAQGRLPLGTPPDSTAPIVLVMGGSQGSAALNDIALSTAVRMATTEVQWLHVSGLGHFESTMNSLKKMAVRSDYRVKSYLEADELSEAMFNCALAVCRSGAGTLAELAAFRKASVLVPYPFAFAQHQLHNAQEFAGMGAAEIIAQDDLTPATLEARIHAWLTDQDGMRSAAKALAEWDVPNAVEEILGIIAMAANRNYAH